MQPDYPMTGQTSTLSVAQNRVLRNTYLLLAVAMIPAVIGAVIGTNLSFAFMRASPVISLIGFLAVFYGLMFAIEKNKDSGVGVGLLLLFTLLLGVMLGPILQVAFARAGGGQLVALAAGGTAAVFFGLATVSSVAKRDFSFMGKFLMAGAIVLLVVMLANAFMQIPAMSLMLSAMFILFSSAAIMFTINQVVRGGETNYISAALTLITGLYNIFTSLLHLLLAFTGNND